MLSSVVILVVLALSGAGLAAWAKSMVPAIGRPAKIGRWFAIGLPAASIAGFALGFLQAEDAVAVSEPDLKQAELAAGVQMMMISLLGGALGMAILSGYLLVMVRLNRD